MPDITVVVLTRDEERNLGTCLTSVSGVAREIFVVDSFSADKTVQIAASLGASVYQHSFETHARQWDWAFQHLPIQTEWILALDADQSLTPELAAELSGMMETVSPELGGFYIKRRYVFCGKPVRFGGYGSKWMLKLFRRSSVLLDEKELLDFRFYVKSGRTGYLKNEIVENNHKDDDLRVWKDKHRRFAKVQAREELRYRRLKRPSWLIRVNPFGSPDERVLFWKSVWYWLPRYVRPGIYFLYRYFFRLGFLDGRNGLIYHGLQAFWYRMLVDREIGRLKHENFAD